MTDIIRHTQVTALGDTVFTVCEFDEGRLVREDITITGPPELLGTPRGAGSGFGRDIYQHSERSGREREIWLNNGRYYP